MYIIIIIVNVSVRRSGLLSCVENGRYTTLLFVIINSTTVTITCSRAPISEYYGVKVQWHNQGKHGDAEASVTMRLVLKTEHTKGNNRRAADVTGASRDRTTKT